MDKPILKERKEQVLAIQWTGNNIDAIREFYNGTVSMWDSTNNVLLLGYDRKNHEEKLLRVDEWLIFSDISQDFSIVNNKEMLLTFH